MPSTLVHVAFAGLLAAGLLDDAFDARAVAVVFVAAALPDLDAFVGLFSSVGHRTVGHTFVLPALLAGLLLVDCYGRETSAVRRRWGRRGVRVAWVSVLALAVAGIGLDLVTGGVNPLWPIHDQFYRFSGKIELSNQRGIVQTFVDLSAETEKSGVTGLGSSEKVHVSTGVNPSEGAEPKDVERVFPIVRSGWELLLTVSGLGVTATRLWWGSDDETDA